MEAEIRNQEVRTWVKFIGPGELEQWCNLTREEEVNVNPEPLPTANTRGNLSSRCCVLEGGQLPRVTYCISQPWHKNKKQGFQQRLCQNITEQTKNKPKSKLSQLTKTHKNNSSQGCFFFCFFCPISGIAPLLMHFNWYWGDLMINAIKKHNLSLTTLTQISVWKKKATQVLPPRGQLKLRFNSVWENLVHD